MTCAAATWRFVPGHFCNVDYGLVQLKEVGTMMWTKIREKLAALFAIVLIFLVFCYMAGQQGWQIPGVIHVARFLGFAQ